LGKKLTLLVRQQARLEGKENNIYSIGRVQAALLYILKAREDEIATFEIKSYWTINSQLKSNESLFNAFLAEEAGLLAPEKHFDSQEDANIFAEKLEILFERATKRYDEEVITFCKAKPMTTAEVLIQANKEYGLTPLQTMNALQCLYDGSYENEIICH
jgi:DNA topoisomerase IA